MTSAARWHMLLATGPFMNAQEVAKSNIVKAMITIIALAEQHTLWPICNGNLMLLLSGPAIWGRKTNLLLIVDPAFPPHSSMFAGGWSFDLVAKAQVLPSPPRPQNGLSRLIKLQRACTAAIPSLMDSV